MGASAQDATAGNSDGVPAGVRASGPPRSPGPTSPRVSIVILDRARSDASWRVPRVHSAAVLSCRSSGGHRRRQRVSGGSHDRGATTPARDSCHPERHEIGFAAGNNHGAAAATGDYVIFLNDDTRVHPDWLRELVDTARRRGAAAVASYILDWSGTMVDFVDGALNFQGKGFQLDYGAPVERLTPEEKPLLFACGCAMLVDRAVLAEVGGWDEGAFAYYEDVELGWRLHVLGYEVWLSPKAVVYHKHHGTSGQWPEPPRQRLYERNSLRALYGLLETESLAASASGSADARRRSRAARDWFEPRRRGTAGVCLPPLAPRAARRRSSLEASGDRRRFRRQSPNLEWRTVAPGAGRPSSKRQWVTSPPTQSYLIEHGGMPATFDVQPQPIPISAAAMLSGIYGFSPRSRSSSHAEPSCSAGGA